MGPEEAGHDDVVAMIEAPVDEERSLGVVNTHHHFDHVGGIRT